MKISTDENNDNDSKALMTPGIEEINIEIEDKQNHNTKNTNINIIKIVHSILKLLIIVICFYIILIKVPNSKQNFDEFNTNTSYNNNTLNNITNNKGFLNIKTYHKGKYTKYNYTDNIKVYKDLYKDIEYKKIRK